MACCVCGENRWEETRRIIICQNCGFAKARERYFLPRTEKVYNNRYYLGRDYCNYRKERDALMRNFADRLRKIRQYLKEGKILEVGSAYGYFLEEAKPYFTVEGVEVNRTAAEWSQNNLGVRVYCGAFEKAALKGTYNAIVALDTIEHLRRPDLFLRKAYRALTPEGFLFLETGDIGSLLSRIQGDNWRLIHPPEHLSYFSQKTIRMILHKFGFKTLRIDRVTFWRTLAQIFFRLYPRGRQKLPEKVVEWLWKISLPSYTGDLIFVTARKDE